MKKLILFFVFTLIFIFSSSSIVLAAGSSQVGSANSYLVSIGTAASGSATPLHPVTIIGTIIKVLLSFLGVVALILFLYAGFLWMTASGATEKVDKAQKIMVQAVIGLVIILAAYAITSFVLGQLAAATGTTSVIGTD